MSIIYDDPRGLVIQRSGDKSRYLVTQRDHPAPGNRRRSRCRPHSLSRLSPSFAEVPVGSWAPVRAPGCLQAWFCIVLMGCSWLNGPAIDCREASTVVATKERGSSWSAVTLLRFSNSSGVIAGRPIKGAEERQLVAALGEGWLRDLNGQISLPSSSKCPPCGTSFQQLPWYGRHEEAR